MAAPRRVRRHQGPRGPRQGRAARQGAQQPRASRRSSGRSRRSPTRSQKQNEDITKLQAKLADAKARERAIVARHKSASGRLKIRSKLYDERITDAFARFEQVERSLDEMEGKVEAYDLGRPRTIADEFAGLEAEASVDEELSALKKRLGNSLKQDAQKQDVR